ncbi:hypothetical protein FACS1894176_04390 [Bacteroidia bacterium]|nr:hypothetical protein FACS1894176_04390 [Bacteroidia bacterium]
MIKKAFTLAETMIVLVIIGILAVVLTQSYLTISKIAFTIEQEKNLSEEALMLTQMIQSITEDATIDYDKYQGKLADTKGFTDTLYLTGELRSGTTISITGNCLPLEGGFQNEEEDPADLIRENSGCQLILTGPNGIITPLIASNGDNFKRIIISKVLFRVIPFDSEANYFSQELGENKTRVNDVAKPGFRMFLHLYSPFYQPIGQNQIDQPLQLFFNLNAPLPNSLTL